MRVLDVRGVDRDEIQEAVCANDRQVFDDNKALEHFDRLYVEGEIPGLEGHQICPHEPRHAMLAVRVFKVSPRSRLRELHCIETETA